MPRVSPIQNSFNAGEFSPMLHGRSDTERYKQGLATCLNAIPLVQGPVTRRAGTRFVSEVKTSSSYTRLIPFKYSDTDAYILEFGHQYIRFYTNYGRVESSPSVAYEIASPYSSTDVNPNDLKYVQSLDVLYLVHPNYAPRKLLRFGATDWVLETIVFKDGPYLNQGQTPVSTVTSLIHSIKLNTSAATGSTTITAKTGDYAALAISTIANNGSGECRVTLVDADEFADRAQVFLSGATGTTGANGTWIAKKISSTQYDLVGSTFNAAYTGSGVIAPAPFKSTDVGRLVRMKISSNDWGYAKITAYTDGATVTATVISTFTATGNTSSFRLGAWSDTTGYPHCAVFHEDRLFFGGAGGALQRIDGSKSGDYENFAPSGLSGTIANDNAVAFSLISNDASAVHWMTSDERGMPIGTSGGPWILRPSTLNEALTATNVSAKRINAAGSHDVQAVQAGKSSIYIETSTRRLRELSYFYDVDGFRSVDLTELAEHLPSEGVATEMAFQSSPQPIVWCSRADGTLLGMTYDRNLDALRTGWHKHQLGGVGDSSGNPPVAESLAVIPSPDGTIDDLWMVVKRYINGAEVRYVEYLEKIFQGFDDQQDAYFVDCGATFDNPLTVVGITGASPAVVTVTGHGFSTGDKVRFVDVVGLVDSDNAGHINGPVFDITVLSVNTFELDGFDSSALTPYIAGGEVRKQVSTISGLDWIEGETVSILGDGAVLPSKVVTAGAITLDFPAGVVHIGLGYETKIQQLRLEAGAADGTSFGKDRRINEVAVMLNRSGSFSYGIDFDDMLEVAMREPDDAMDAAPPLFTGIKSRLGVPSGYDLDNQLTFKVSEPTPFTLLAVMPQQVTYDKS